MFEYIFVQYKHIFDVLQILDKLYQNKETTWELETADDDQSLVFPENDETKKKSNKRDSSLLESEPTSKREYCS